LKHELGIVSSQVSADKIKYLGRIHYCAADDSTDAPAAGSMEGTSDGVWGEHEIDYILFVKATVDVFPNPEEVRASAPPFSFYTFSDELPLSPRTPR
jgi:isopentenyl-diphosphate Delta-isomerase